MRHPIRTAAALTAGATMVLLASCGGDGLGGVLGTSASEEPVDTAAERETISPAEEPPEGAAPGGGSPVPTEAPGPDDELPAVVTEAPVDEPAAPDEEPPDEEPPDEEPPGEEPPAEGQPVDQPPTGEGTTEEAGSNADEAPTEHAPLAASDPARISTISDGFRARMKSTTWEPGCPVGIDELRKLSLRYVDLDDAEREGEMIVHAEVAEDLLHVFARLYEQRFPIERIDPIEDFDGDDDASMAANNTSAFNCRPITGSDSWSQHAYGWAVDINPIQNPYVRDGEVLPPEGEPYLDRSDQRPGMVTRPGVVEHFDEIGWGWGGDWSSLKDYMHFSLTGR